MQIEFSIVIEELQAALAHCAGKAAQMLISPGSKYSLAALACATMIAAIALLSRRKRKRPIRLRVLLRALFPRRLWRSASGRADIIFSLFNVFLAAALFGWAVVSAAEVSGWIQAALAGAFGPASPKKVPDLACATAMTVALYLAFELAYWFDHYLSHKIPLLWRFHAVHHSAQSLSPLTNFRVHPIDSIVFYNLIALFMGVTEALLNYGLGRATNAFTLGGTNMLLLASGILLTHLQHSHLWISFTGRWGRILLSPAHHQIHHSADERHFDRNFGSSLALWDWLFGTLHVPARERERLTFGIPYPGYDPHRAGAALVMPLAAAIGGAGRRLAQLLHVGGPALELDKPKSA